MSKMPLSYQAQLDLFKSRGLIVNNEPFALHCLAHHNYYRLSAYRFPFTVQGDPDSFLPDTTFEQIWQLYDFDRGLRKLIIEACKRVEISVRSRWAYEIGHQLGPQAYEDACNFPKFKGHAKTMQKLDEEMSRSHELFVQHYQQKYNTTRPEVWVAIEVASFGTISKLLKHTAPPRLRQDIADTYRLDEKTLCSLFHHLSILRNTAAHHSRIWNRKFTFLLQLPKKKPAGLYPNFHESPSDHGTRTRKLYNSLVLLIHCLQIIEPRGDWPQRLITHLKTLPTNLIPDMGFPTDWQTRPIWQQIPTT
jgi:abortive infection bacteriophage resistance protein